MRPELDIYQAALKLLLALIIGILFGIERDIKRLSSAKPESESKHFGGIRTFAIIGLLGGLLSYLGILLGHPVYIYGFLAVTIFLASSYIIEHRKGGSLGMTSEFSALLAYTLGALAVLGPMNIAVAVSILALLLLSQKKKIGSWTNRIQSIELLASLKFALVLFVIFPFLKGIPPVAWHGIEIIDPFRVWKMVVLISSVSFVGYFAARFLGAERGILLTGVFGGLASSTAVTQAMAAKSHELKHRQAERVLAATTLVANAVSFARVFVILLVLNPGFARHALFAILAMTALSLVSALFVLRGFHIFKEKKPRTAISFESPFSLRPALFFGFLYALVIFLIQFAKKGVGDAGVYLLSFVSGFPDIDAIAVTLANLVDGNIPATTGTLALLLAISSNCLFKSIIARSGGTAFWRQVSVGLGVAIVGAFTIFFIGR